MIKSRQAFLVLSFLTMAYMASAQIKLQDLSQFQGPKGEWFQAANVLLDSSDLSQFDYEPGTSCFINGESGRTKHLVSKESYGDIELHLEFLLPQGSNSGVYLQSRYELQIFDSYGKESPQHSDCGGIYQRWDESRPTGEKGYEGMPPRLNACLPLGEWQSYDVIFRAPKFNSKGEKIRNAIFEKVALNGVIIHTNKEVTGATREGLDGPEVALGPLRLQGDHGRVAYRNIRIRKLSEIDDDIEKSWVSLFRSTGQEPNYDFIAHGDVSQEEANRMFEMNGDSLMVMYNWEKESAPYGVAVTKKIYKNYDLRFQFKWGDRRFAPRLLKKRDAGLLYHCQVGTYAWPPSLEYQIQEGDCGDLWNILGCRGDVLKDGNVTTIDIADYSRSVKWSDAEREGWNDVLLEVRKDGAKYYLNGELVNEIVNAKYGGVPCTSGFIALQAEYAELIYRNIEVREF